MESRNSNFRRRLTSSAKSMLCQNQNFESIHNHSAYALIEKDKTAD